MCCCGFAICSCYHYSKGVFSETFNSPFYCKCIGKFNFRRNYNGNIKFFSSFNGLSNWILGYNTRNSFFCGYFNSYLINPVPYNNVTRFGLIEESENTFNRFYISKQISFHFFGQVRCSDLHHFN